MQHQCAMLLDMPRCGITTRMYACIQACRHAMLRHSLCPNTLLPNCRFNYEPRKDRYLEQYKYLVNVSNFAKVCTSSLEGAACKHK